MPDDDPLDPMSRYLTGTAANQAVATTEVLAAVAGLIDFLAQRGIASKREIWDHIDAYRDARIAKWTGLAKTILTEAIPGRTPEADTPPDGGQPPASPPPPPPARP